MRGGDGDTVILQRFCTLILFLCFIEIRAADEYLVSYGYTIKNAIIYNEKLQIAKAMQPCEGEPIRDSLLLPYPKNSDEDRLSVKTLLQKNFDEFFSYISKLGLEIEHREKTTDMQNHSITRLTLQTTCFKVDFNDSFVTITAIK